MKLILVRHAEAAEKTAGGSDEARPLTDHGREQARKLADAFQAHAVDPDFVVTSPLVRARETAEPLLPLMGEGKEATVCDLLAPGEFKPKKVSRFVADLGGEVVVVVGHNPDLSGYAEWLLDAEEAAVELEKGAAALFDCPSGPEKGGGRLVWLVTPAWFLNAVAPVGG